MGKYERLGAGKGLPIENLFPDGFDGRVIAEFFSGIRSGVSEDVLDAIEAALDSDDADTGNLEFGGYLTTTEDDMLSHAHGHDHGNDHVCDGDCGDDCPHAENHESETDVSLFNGAANGKPTHAKGGNKTDDGTSTKGGGKGKNNTTDPVAEEPVAEEPVAQEPVIEEPVAEEPVAEEPIVSEPAPEPTPAPTPSNFGWLDSSTYLSGGDTPDGFNIELKFYGSTWTMTQKNAAAEMAEYISDFIIGDLADYGAIDDVRIQMYNENIDGAGSVWGQGGWIQLRGDGMVAEGGVRVDSNDIGTAEDRGMMDELFMHEMLHAIGFGTTWSRDGLISGGNYVGQNGMDVYGGPVPYDGNGHLSESVGNQMGTTHISNGAEPITDLTLAILEDMGFDTIYGSEAAFV